MTRVAEIVVEMDDGRKVRLNDYDAQHLMQLVRMKECVERLIEDHVAGSMYRASSTYKANAKK
jgi:hypothetical protein